MKLITINYTHYEQHVPQEGQHILAQLRGENIVVYQAFNPTISKYAVSHQCFGGAAYSFSRMSWIKPNFLWMMYRAGWASKENQERILAIEIPQVFFERLLEEAVYSSYKSAHYSSRESWQAQVKQSDVRLQWDPDHNPYGAKLTRRAIQLGMRGNTLHAFNKAIVSVEDITAFVVEQGAKVKSQNLEELLVMEEEGYQVKNSVVQAKLGMVIGN